ncbi:hypothetical protein WJX74_006756 [Apatococcus lobatus]|uniref:Uncharacterized protein n=1 Tax=Apatococcus lobatus TaxID=904363 RepID=A0AAW1SA10_9CHLO
MAAHNVSNGQLRLETSLIVLNGTSASRAAKHLNLVGNACEGFLKVALEVSFISDMQGSKRRSEEAEVPELEGRRDHDARQRKSQASLRRQLRRARLRERGARSVGLPRRNCSSGSTDIQQASLPETNLQPAATHCPPGPLDLQLYLLRQENAQLHSRLASCTAMTASIQDHMQHCQADWAKLLSKSAQAPPPQAPFPSIAPPVQDLDTRHSSMQSSSSHSYPQEEQTVQNDVELALWLAANRPAMACQGWGNLTQQSVQFGDLAHPAAQGSLPLQDNGAADFEPHEWAFSLDVLPDVPGGIESVDQLATHVPLLSSHPGCSH